MGMAKQEVKQEVKQELTKEAAWFAFEAKLNTIRSAYGLCYPKSRLTTTAITELQQLLETIKQQITHK